MDILEILNILLMLDILDILDILDNLDIHIYIDPDILNKLVMISMWHKLSNILDILFIFHKDIENSRHFVVVTKIQGQDRKTHRAHMLAI